MKRFIVFITLSLGVAALFFTCKPQTVSSSDGPSWLLSYDDSVEIILDSPTPRTNGPTDWRDEIIYFMLTDRFNDGNAANNPTDFTNKNNIAYYHGGDIQGIQDQIDYLRRLGITAVWITPVTKSIRMDGPNCGYHGYWPRDFTDIDETLADSTADYKTFVDNMHNNGLLVIQDIIVNHMANMAVYDPAPADGVYDWHATYNDAGYTDAEYLWLDETTYMADGWVTTQLRERPPAPWDNKDWYHGCGTINYANSTSILKGDLNSLEDLDTSNNAVQNALASAYSNWILWSGVDGFRIDTVRHVEPEFWYDATYWDTADTGFSKKMRDTVNANFSGKKFIQFGEYYEGWADTAAVTDNISANRLDSLLNYELYYCINRLYLDNPEGTRRLKEELDNRETYLRSTGITNGGAELGADECTVNFIDNHDKTRFLGDDSKTVYEMWNALGYIMTTKGIPCIYYNTENEVGEGTNGGENGRISMPDFTTTDKKTFTLINKLSEVRNDYIALRRGEIEALKWTTDDEGAGIFAFVRYTGTESENIYVLLNTSDKSITETIDISSQSTTKTELTNVLKAAFGQTETVSVSGNEITVNLEPYDIKIFN